MRCVCSAGLSDVQSITVFGLAGARHIGALLPAAAPVGPRKAILSVVEGSRLITYRCEGGGGTVRVVHLGTPRSVEPTRITRRGHPRPGSEVIGLLAVFGLGGNPRCGSLSELVRDDVRAVPPVAFGCLHDGDDRPASRLHRHLRPRIAENQNSPVRVRNTTVLDRDPVLAERPGEGVTGDERCRADAAFVRVRQARRQLFVADPARTVGAGRCLLDGFHDPSLFRDRHWNNSPGLWPSTCEYKPDLYPLHEAWLRGYTPATSYWGVDVMKVLRHCQRCEAGPEPTAGSVVCRACQLDVDALGVPEHTEDFWQRPALRAALESQHFGQVLRAYRQAHAPQISQIKISNWLEMTQANVSLLERKVKAPPSDLRKLRRWAATIRMPVGLWWFAPDYSSDYSDTSPGPANLDDVHRRDMLKLTGAALVTGSGLLSDPPWKRLSDTMAGERRAGPSTVAMAEQKTREFFRSEETQPARALAAELRSHHEGLRRMIDTTTDDSLRRRLISAAGETAALAGWTLFDLARPNQAVKVYENALRTAREADDQPLVACILGYWSYLLSSSGDAPGAVRMLTDASQQVRGSDAATQAWILARLAEEEAAVRNAPAALRSLDQAVVVFDYASPDQARPWTSFFTANRLGSLAVSTYGRVHHRETDQLAATLLGSLAPTENKVRALVLADLATSAARGGDFDRVEALSSDSAPLATRTEATLAIDRLWEVVELLPDNGGSAGQTRRQLTERLVAATAN